MLRVSVDPRLRLMAVQLAVLDAVSAECASRESLLGQAHEGSGAPLENAATVRAVLRLVEDQRLPPDHFRELRARSRGRLRFLVPLDLGLGNV